MVGISESTFDAVVSLHRQAVYNDALFDYICSVFILTAALHFFFFHISYAQTLSTSRWEIGHLCWSSSVCMSFVCFMQFVVTAKGNANTMRGLYVTGDRVSAATRETIVMKANELQ